MKKLTLGILSIVSVVALLLGLGVADSLIARAQSTPPITPFVYSGNAIKTQLPLPVTISNLANSSTDCLYADASGTLKTAAGACGSGGGSSSTLIYPGSYIGVTASGTNGYIISNTGVTSTAGLLTVASGSATYYPLTNPSGYLSSSTGLSYFFPATTTIFQSALNGAYVSSFNGATGTITFSTPATTTINGLQSPSFLFTAAGTGLTVSTSSTSTVTYTWTNPGYITTSTFNATGTAFYFPYWNSAGNALSPTSTIFIASSTGNVGIGTTTPNSPLQFSSRSFPSASTLPPACCLRLAACYHY